MTKLTFVILVAATFCHLLVGELHAASACPGVNTLKTSNYADYKKAFLTDAEEDCTIMELTNEEVNQKLIANGVLGPMWAAFKMMQKTSAAEPSVSSCPGVNTLNVQNFEDFKKHYLMEDYNNCTIMELTNEEVDEEIRRITGFEDAMLSMFKANL